jgi:hypothetical protein
MDRGRCREFLLVVEHRPITSDFRRRHHLIFAPKNRQHAVERFQAWREITGTIMIA